MRPSGTPGIADADRGDIERQGRLSGTVSIVTGAAGGLGSAIVDRLVSEGSQVAALDIRQRSAGLLAEGVAQWRCDVTDQAQIGEVVNKVVSRFGGVDILVNAAGLLSGRASLLEASAEELHRFFSVNAVGVLSMVQACHQYLKHSRHRGRIINVASRTFFTGSPGQLAYVASKGALIGMTKVMARELGPDRITANAVLPAQIATKGTLAHATKEVFAATMSQQAIQEPVSPEDVAGLVAYLASPDGSMVTGQSLVCDGGGLLR